MKQTVVIKVSMTGHKCQRKALKIAVSISGVYSASLKGEDKNQIEVVGDGVDVIELTKLLRKNVGHAELSRICNLLTKTLSRSLALPHSLRSPIYKPLLIPRGDAPPYAAPRLLALDYGEVHVNEWRVDKVAKGAAGLILKEKVEFEKEDYSGYHNKRGGGINSNKTFPLKCFTFTFKFWSEET